MQRWIHPLVRARLRPLHGHPGRARQRRDPRARQRPGHDRIRAHFGLDDGRCHRRRHSSARQERLEPGDVAGPVRRTPVLVGHGPCCARLARAGDSRRRLRAHWGRFRLWVPSCSGSERWLLICFSVVCSLAVKGWARVRRVSGRNEPIEMTRFG